VILRSRALPLLQQTNKLTNQPTNMGNEAPDPCPVKNELDLKCHKTPNCSKMWELYEACGERIKQKGKGECSPWYQDYWGCIDKCVSGIINA